MNNSILIELFKKFTPKEMKEFEEFVHSPFFNKNQSVTKLFEYIRKQYPGFKAHSVEKKLIYSTIFPDVEYNDGFLRTLMFNLSELAERYLAYIRFNSVPFAEDRYLLHELNERECDKLFERKMKEILKEIKETDIQNAGYFYSKFAVEHEYFYYLSRTNLDKIEKLVNRPDVEEMFYHITYFYYFQAIRHYVYFLNRRGLYQIDFKTELFEDIYKIIDPKYFQSVPLLNLYYDVLTLYLNEDNFANYYNIKKNAVELENKITKHELIWIYINLQNFCDKMIMKGHNEFLEELFDIYKLKLEKKIYAWQEMPAKFYGGVVDIALKLKEFKWAKDFIENYKDELSPKSRDYVFYYSLALYEFSLNNFESSLELLSKVKYTEVYQKIELRCLMAELYYELDMDDVLLSHIDAFRHFLMNDKLIPSGKKETYSGFIKYIKALSILKNKKSSEEVYLLTKKISDNPVIFNKEWLLKKLETISD
ncbi:MAG: hypothetical protein EHM58_12545 [Ignavibacteriae bacterium]|nr:MAG: hypothetical protein EHM58_12545 [Ignavibacteriota bacterium]